MVDPSTHYDLGRLNVLVEYSPDREMWLVSALRRATPRFKSASVVAWCSCPEMAQELAHLIIGIEITREGAAIWPDGRTGPGSFDPIPGRIAAAHHLLSRLLAWADRMGVILRNHTFDPLDLPRDWDAHVWVEVRAFLDTEPEEGDQ